MTPTQLRRQLRRLGLSQMELSRRLKVGPRTVRRWVSGEHRIPEMLVQLIDCWLTAAPRRR